MQIIFRKGKILKKKGRVETYIPLEDIQPSVLEAVKIYQWFLVSFVRKDTITQVDPDVPPHIPAFKIETETAKIDKVSGYYDISSSNMIIYEIVVVLHPSVKEYKKEILTQIKSIFKKNSGQEPPRVTIKYSEMA